jgi:hypothetical protein
MSGTVTEIAGAELDAGRFLHEIVESCRPVVIRGLVSHWPAVQAAHTPTVFRAYLRRFDAGGQMEAFFGERRIAGKYYYSDDLAGFNFERRRMHLSDALDLILSDPGAGDQSVYAGSLVTADFLPGFDVENAMPLLDRAIGGRIWLGHASNVSAHYDTADNLACVVAGRRRFTLYAPELIASLYVGPIDNTMAGQPVSMAASSRPDDERFPRFTAVRDQAMTAELLAGDALYLPKLWWHQVEATAPFNALVNYWWDPFAAGPDAPYTAMLLAMIAISERPSPERQAWKALFSHYVFRDHGHPLAHLPPERHGVLGPLKDNYGRIRARVMQMLRGG